MELVTDTQRLDELFLSFGLLPEDNVWLVGGHEGLQAEFLLTHYPGISLDIYEPQEIYVRELKKKFSGKPVEVHDYALGDRTGQFIMGLEDTDGCTFHWKHLMDAGLIEQPTETYPMEDIKDELSRKWWYPAFLMMNCEGSELEIIKRLDGLHHADGFPKILIQFHSRTLGFEGCQEAYDLLCKTHEIKWRYNDWAWVYAEVKTD